jgi:hypothetical protein
MQASRIIIAAIALWIVAVPAVVRAEQPKRVPQVALLVPPPPAGYDPANNPYSRAMLGGLQALGYVEGQSIHIDLRLATNAEEASAMARDLVEHKKVDVIVAVGPQLIEAAKGATEASRSSFWPAIVPTGWLPPSPGPGET